jgi:hypothetical protein
MTIQLRAWTVGVGMAAVFILAGCGDPSGSPTSPSSSARPSGATISGRVIGATGAATASSQEVSATATSGITIKVSGTNISSVADGSGQFVLSDVPPGSVRLEFSGQGTSATMTIDRVNQGDRIEIIVMLNGSDASLRSHVVDTEGNVSGVSGSCPSIMFTVRDRLIRTSASTSFREGSCASIHNGTRVEAKGALGADGSIQASIVELGDDNGDGNRDMELTGTVGGLNGNCPTISFRLGDVTIMTDSATTFDDRCSAVQNGRRVEVKGVRSPDGGVVRATRVGVD